jgi:hypothetical protein
VTQEGENLILRLLRETRVEQGAMTRSLDRIGQRMTTLERKMDDVNESVGYALALSAHANVAYETTGQRIDRMRETVDDPRARVEALETKQ